MGTFSLELLRIQVGIRPQSSSALPTEISSLTLSSPSPCYFFFPLSSDISTDTKNCLFSCATRPTQSRDIRFDLACPSLPNLIRNVFSRVIGCFYLVTVKTKFFISLKMFSQ